MARRRRKIAADARASSPRGHLSTSEYKWLGVMSFSRCTSGMAGRDRFMRASAVSTDTINLARRVVVAGLLVDPRPAIPPDPYVDRDGNIGILRRGVVTYLMVEVGDACEVADAREARAWTLDL